MQEAINKAAALVEAHAYIRSFAGRVVVVKVGGSIMDTPEALGALIQDVCFMRSVGMRPILVHGGGKGITAAMEKAGWPETKIRKVMGENWLRVLKEVWGA